uniref:Uncharacterized protein n=1 Tax=uncultured organism TaxID=155900 RepID=M1P0W0_9ZZZZ|nr:hypothetical protein FLSS-6_0021 [uncultured organism]
MVETEKTLMAIEEKKKWEEREEEILEHLEELREKKKKLQERADTLQNRIRECQDTLRSLTRGGKENGLRTNGLKDQFKHM